MKVVQEAAHGPEERTARAQLTAVAHELMEGAAHETAIVKLGLLDSLDAILDDESRRTEREFRFAIERVIAEGKAQGTACDRQQSEMRLVSIRCVYIPSSDISLTFRFLKRSPSSWEPKSQVVSF